MFGALGRLASRRPWFVIAAWIVFAGLVIALAPAFKATQDQAEFLPDHYESIRAFTLQDEAFPQSSQVGAIIVFDRTDGGKLTADDSAQVQQVVDGLQLEDAFTGVQVQPPSENGLVQLAVVGLSDDVTGYDTASFDAVKKLRSDLDDSVGGDLRYGVTGNVAQSYDQQESGNQALLIVGLATVLLIVVLLALIFRSVLICLMPIVVVFLVSQIALGLIATANELFDLKASQDIETILVVVLYGIGTDYILFFLFRYRERLREGEEKRPAVAHALERAGEAIASAGGAVIVAFMALVLSSLGIFRSIGPALAIAVAVTLLAALTLVPAVVTVLGRALFWPSKKYLVEPEAARFAAVGQSVGRHPGRYALVSGGVLGLLTLAAFTFNPSFDLGGSSTSGDVESAVALQDPREGLPGGRHRPHDRPASQHGRRTAGRGRDGRVRHRPQRRRRGGAGRAAHAVRGRRHRVVQRLPRGRPRLRRGHRGGEGADPRRGPRGRAGRHRGAGRRDDVGVRGLPGRDDPRLQGGLPGRGPRHHAHPGAAAAQPGRAALPHGRGRRSVSAPPWVPRPWCSRTSRATRGCCSCSRSTSTCSSSRWAPTTTS